MEKAKGANFSWIQRSVYPTTSSFDPGTGVCVGNCLPAFYPSYLKIFHPIFEDTSITDHQITWDEWEKSGAGKAESAYREATAATQTMANATLVVSPAIRFDPGFRRVTWRRLAEQSGLFFHPEFNNDSYRVAFPKSWPRYLYGPAEGYFERGSYSRLIAALAQFTEPQFVYLKMPDIWKAGEDAPRLFRGAIDEVADFLHTLAPFQSPEYFWPEDRSWCVNSDNDLAFTFVGGSSSLITTVASSEDFESIEVRPEMRVDYLADRLNARGRGHGTT